MTSAPPAAGPAAALTSALERVAAGESGQLARLAEFVRIPSVSADPAHAADVAAAADWLAGELRRIGLEHVEVHPTPLHPIVTADWLHAGPDAPTVLVYGHVDVQPVEPLEAWTSPPFELTERDGRLYARGSTDDKGQLYMHIAAVEAMFAAGGGRLPCNLRFLSDGEEEIGSPSLAAFLDAHPDLIAADVALVSDSPMYAHGVPSVGYALRGLCYVEVSVETAATDLHSGQFGGAVPNAAQVLVDMLATLHDADGRVTVPGFYESVAPVPDAERAALGGLPFDEPGWLAAVGAAVGCGESGYSTLERTWIRPTLELNGLTSGHQGSGPKTIVPARASAKVSCRLVPDQRPEEVGALVSAHLTSLAPPGARVTATASSSTGPAVTPTDDPAVRTAVAALRTAFGAEPYLIRDGGAIPAVALLQDLLGIRSVLLGFGCPDENKHGPDEWLSLEHYRRGLETLVRFWHDLAEEKTR
ncbi:dipeptidase [Streptosporangium sp. NPDC051022]|uniref:dipeptidase n=1 Tax=Streptosporangium sp. NPDC051022 TaxID=3155752 RepID=UPI00343B36EC